MLGQMSTCPLLMVDPRSLAVKLVLKVIGSMYLNHAYITNSLCWLDDQSSQLAKEVT